MPTRQKANDKFTLEQVLAAIRGSSGIKSTIARRLGNCSRNTVDAYLNKYATAQQAFEEESEKVGDLVESVIINSIRQNNVETAKWYASRKLRNRGYIDKIEQRHSGPNGGPIQHEQTRSLAEWEAKQAKARAEVEQLLRDVENAQNEAGAIPN